MVLNRISCLLVFLCSFFGLHSIPFRFHFLWS
uniref:Uncharacterized protein n=1 Tax=Arundo donax TaxID=35708 RepID=A0A0A9A2U5_ARUDO